MKIIPPDRCPKCGGPVFFHHLARMFVCKAQTCPWDGVSANAYTQAGTRRRRQ